jgi:hypothetical protein
VNGVKLISRGLAIKIGLAGVNSLLKQAIARVWKKCRGRKRHPEEIEQWDGKKP